MGLFLSNGTRVTKTTVAKTADPDPLVKITTDLYLREAYSKTDPNPAGSKLTLFCRAGKVLRQSELDLLFPAPVVSSVTPATGGVAGGTVVTIKGKNLDGVTAVTFGGTAATAVSVVAGQNGPEVRCTTPAKAAGAVAVAVTDDGGTGSKAAGYTFA